MTSDLSFIEEYPEKIQPKIYALIEDGGIEDYLHDLYPEEHKILTDKALFTYAQDLRKKYMKKSPPIHKVVFDDGDENIYNALGLKDNELILFDNGHKIKNVMRISSIFKNAPAELFLMVVVHELVHIKERSHTRSFYRLCHLIDEDYTQHELDLRLFLISQGL